MMQKWSMEIFKRAYSRIMMRISRCILLCPFQLFAFLVLMSCGSSKNVTQSKSEKDEKRDVTEQTASFLNRETHEDSQSNEETEVIETIIEYSEPDSIGNQYPKKKTERKTVSKKGNEGEKKVTEKVSTEKNVVDKSKVKEAEKSKEKTEVKESNQPVKIIVGCFVVVCIFVFGIRFFKK